MDDVGLNALQGLLRLDSCGQPAALPQLRVLVLERNRASSVAQHQLRRAVKVFGLGLDPEPDSDTDTDTDTEPDPEPDAYPEPDPEPEPEPEPEPDQERNSHCYGRTVKLEL